MTSLRLLLVALLGACGLVLATPVASQACSCVGGTVADYVEWSDAIFVGTLVEVTPPPDRAVMSSSDPVTYTFDVDTVHEGDVAGTAEVTTAMSSASCGLEGLQVGTAYVVFATADGGGLGVSSCGGTSRAHARLISAVDRIVGPGRAPESEAWSVVDVAEALRVLADWW